MNRDIGEAESEVRKGNQVTPPPPRSPASPTRLDRDSGTAVRGVGGAQGGPGDNTGTGTEGMETGIIRMDRLTGAAQDVVSEEAATLVG